MKLDAPFPWFGGKRKVAAEVWRRFGGVRNYVEPFFGSGAVLLGRPLPVDGNETINDLDGYVANFWRSIQLSPEPTAEHADNPVNENDMHARHVWLVQRADTLRAQLEGDPEWHDPKIAGWWVWGISCWIGSGFCSGNGPWSVDESGKLVQQVGGRGVTRKRIHLGTNGQGVKRQLVHLGGGGGGQGVNRSRSDGRLLPWFHALAERLRRVRVCSGDWSRVCGPSVTFKHGTTAVFLDPPYADTAGRNPDLYRVDDLDVAHAVRDWAVANGDNPLMRIALCGYDGEHEMPVTWTTHAWKGPTGYGGLATTPTGNRYKERIWFSPHCLSAHQGDLFPEAALRTKGQ